MSVGAAVALGTLGAVIGSFLNVVVHRVPRRMSVSHPPSSCGACGHRIRWYDNIPIVSWLVLRARCRDCAAPISARYPLLEAATAAGFALVAFRFAPSVFAAEDVRSGIAAALVLVAFIYLAAISIALAAIDVETKRLPNAIVLPAYGVGAAAFLGAAALTGDWARLGAALLGTLVMGGVYLLPLLMRPDAIGGGDVKLAGVLGLFLGWLGWPELGVGIIAGFLLGGLYGVMLILAGLGRRARIAFGPWLLLGAWVGIFAGSLLLNGYLGLFGLEVG